jgi:hypothetical protein
MGIYFYEIYKTCIFCFLSAGSIPQSDWFTSFLSHKFLRLFRSWFLWSLISLHLCFHFFYHGTVVFVRSLSQHSLDLVFSSHFLNLLYPLSLFLQSLFMFNHFFYVLILVSSFCSVSSIPLVDLIFLSYQSLIPIFQSFSISLISSVYLSPSLIRSIVLVSVKFLVFSLILSFSPSSFFNLIPSFFFY